MELYTLVLGLDVLGNPVNVVRGVVGGTIDLFYEPIKVCRERQRFYGSYNFSFILILSSFSPFLLSPPLSLSLPLSFLS